LAEIMGFFDASSPALSVRAKRRRNDMAPKAQTLLVGRVACGAFLCTSPQSDM